MRTISQPKHGMRVLNPCTVHPPALETEQTLYNTCGARSETGEPGRVCVVGTLTPRIKSPSFTFGEQPLRLPF